MIKEQSADDTETLQRIIEDFGVKEDKKLIPFLIREAQGSVGMPTNLHHEDIMMIVFAINCLNARMIYDKCIDNGVPHDIAKKQANDVVVSDAQRSADYAFSLN